LVSFGNFASFVSFRILNLLFLFLAPKEEKKVVLRDPTTNAEIDLKKMKEEKKENQQESIKKEASEESCLPPFPFSISSLS